MNFVSPTVDIKSTVWDGMPCLYFTFKGKFTTEASKLASAAWDKELSLNSDTQYIFIWDCMDMSGFELDARKQWYQYMTKNKTQFQQIIAISGNILIRSAASVMFKVLNIPGTVMKSKEELKALMDGELEVI